jgi:hypothetical protein
LLEGAKATADVGGFAYASGEVGEDQSVVPNGRTGGRHWQTTLGYTCIGKQHMSSWVGSVMVVASGRFDPVMLHLKVTLVSLVAVESGSGHAIDGAVLPGTDAASIPLGEAGRGSEHDEPIALTT